MLEVDPAAAPEAITAAYRRKARVLHPDVPGTGDAAAFIRLKAGLRRAERCPPPRRLRSPARAASRVARRAAGTRSRPAGTAPVGPADRAVGRPRRVLCWRRSWRWCSSTVLRPAPQHGPVDRPTAPRRPRPGPAAAAGRRRPAAARPPTTCCPPAAMPCFGDTISRATAICRPDMLPRSVRCRRCAWSRSTVWWRSAGRRRQRLHRRRAAGAGRSPDRAAGLLRLQCRTSAAERRDARPPGRRRGTYRDQQPRPAAGGGQAARRLRPCRRHRVRDARR